MDFIKTVFACTMLNTKATLGPYTVIKKIGEGSFCKVYLGLDTRNNKKVAIKILNGKISTQLMKDVKNEITALITIN